MAAGKDGAPIRRTRRFEESHNAVLDEVQRVGNADARHNGQTELTSISSLNVAISLLLTHGDNSSIKYRSRQASCRASLGAGARSLREEEEGKPHRELLQYCFSSKFDS